MSLGDTGIVVGTARSERADAIDLVRRWFDLLASQDVSGAASLMSASPVIVTSGGARYVSLAAFVDAMAERAATVRKQCEHFEACEAPGGFAVYVRGGMSGAWPDGRSFTAVRWVDRLLVQGGRISEVQTWSDLSR